MDIYRYQRYFWLSHFMQLRMMIRERHPQSSEARMVLKRSQAQAARLRLAAYKPA